MSGGLPLMEVLLDSLSQGFQGEIVISLLFIRRIIKSLL